MDGGGYIPNQVSPLLFTENMSEALEEKVVRLTKDYYVILRFWCYCNIQQWWNFSNMSDKREHDFVEFISRRILLLFSLMKLHKRLKQIKTFLIIVIEFHSH